MNEEITSKETQLNTNCATTQYKQLNPGIFLFK